MNNLYDKIKEVITLDTDSRLFCCYLKKIATTNFNETENKIFTLLNKVSQIYIDINNLTIKLSTLWLSNTKNSTYKLEDITDEELILLQNIDFDLLPLNFRAFLCFIIWHKKNKNNYDKMLIAFNSYIELFNHYLKTNNEVWARNSIVIAYYLSTKIKPNSKEFTSYKNTVLNAFIKNNIEFALTQTLICLLGKMDESIFTKVNNKLLTIDYQDAYQKIKFFEIKLEFYKSQKKENFIKTTINELAKYLYKTGQGLIDKQPNYSYQILLYLLKLNRNHNLNYDSNKIILSIDKCKANINSNMGTIELPNINSFIQKWQPFLKKSFSQLTLQEFVIAITNLVKIYDKTDIKEELINNPQFIAVLFPQIILDGNNQSVEILQPLDLANPENDPENLEKHINRRILTKECIDGITYLKCSLDLLSQKYESITLTDLDFILKQNNLIPPGRANIIKYGLYLSLTGHYYEALHILTPQIENIFRYFANLNGLSTTCLESNGDSEVKLFGPTLELLLRNKIITESEHFFLSSLLNKPSGANIRNRIAHGLMTEEEGQSGVSIYFCCFTIKLLVNHSLECKKLKNQSIALKNLFNYDGQAVY